MGFIKRLKARIGIKSAKVAIGRADAAKKLSELRSSRRSLQKASDYTRQVAAANTGIVNVINTAEANQMDLSIRTKLEEERRILDEAQRQYPRTKKPIKKAKQK
jgi:hypothetical protein